MHERLLLERFNYGGTTTLRNSLNKEAATKLTKLNQLVGPRGDSPQLKGASDNDSGLKVANLSLQKLRSIDKAVVVRKPPQQSKANNLVE